MIGGQLLLTPVYLNMISLHLLLLHTNPYPKALKGMNGANCPHDILKKYEESLNKCAKALFKKYIMTPVI